jgi:hypothetical protein
MQLQVAAGRMMAGVCKTSRSPEQRNRKSKPAQPPGVTPEGQTDRRQPTAQDTNRPDQQTSPSGLARYLAQTTTTRNLVVHCEFVVVEKVRRGEHTIGFLRVFATLPRRDFSSWFCDSSFGFVASRFDGFVVGCGCWALWGFRGYGGAHRWSSNH